MARESFKATPGDRRNMVNLPASADDLPEVTLIDLNSKTPAVPIAIVDDTPEDDRGRPTEWDGASTLDENDDDLQANVSERTAKRLKRMKAEVETARRAKEASDRERDAAIELASQQAAEVADLRRRGESGATALANSMKAEREAKMADARRRLAQAHADGDAEAIATATADMSIAASELTQIAARTPTPRTPEQQQQDRQAQQPQRQQQAPNIAPNVTAWISHNDRWFNRDPAKTKFALSIHEAVVSRGIRPESPEYTRELDRGMKAMYPDHQPYEQSDGTTTERTAPRRTNGVTEGSREDGVQRPALREGQVELTRSEVSLAQKMRIQLDKYADEKRKRLQREGNGA